MSGPEILVVLNRPQAAAGCLRAAADAAGALPAAQIAVLHVRADPLATILPSEEVLSGEQLAALRRRAPPIARRCMLPTRLGSRPHRNRSGRRQKAFRRSRS